MGNILKLDLNEVYKVNDELVKNNGGESGIRTHDPVLAR